MKRERGPLWATIVLLLFLVAGAAVMAQTSAGFNLEWHVIGGGGGESTSANYEINGTAGQSLAGPPDSDSGSFVVRSGFWSLGTERRVFLPVLRTSPP